MHNEKTTIFIDGSSGTAGLRIYDRLAQRADIDLLTLPPELHHDIEAQRELLNRADIAFLCLPDAAAITAADLVENPDILATLGERKEQQVVVGFAAETNDVVANAEKKLVSKHADLVVANEVGGGRAFGADDNVVWFVDDQDVEELPRMSKTRLADEILNKAIQFLA